MPDHRTPFQDARGPQPWEEDERLVRMLLRWLDTTCLLRGHQLRPAERVQGPDRWRRFMITLLEHGRNHASLQARDDVLLAIEQTEPELAEQLPAASEHLSLPDVKIASHAEE